MRQGMYGMYRPRAAALALLALGALWPSAQPSAQAQAAPGTSASLSLKPSYGGALVLGRLTVPKDDELLGVWSNVGRARLMKCAPLCQVVKTLPVKGTTILGSASGYRIVLGGSFTVGQKVTLVFRFQNAQILNVSTTVTR